MSEHRKRTLGIGAAIACMVLMTAAIFVQQNRLSRAVKQIGTQHTTLVEGCVRLNIVRAEANSSYYADYVFFRVFLLDIQQNLKHPQRPQTALEKKQTIEFVGILQRGIEQKTWTPLTNCNQAINTKGVRYRPPEPIRFTQRLPPAAEMKPPPS